MSILFKNLIVSSLPWVVSCGVGSEQRLTQGAVITGTGNIGDYGIEFIERRSHEIAGHYSFMGNSHALRQSHVLEQIVGEIQEMEYDPPGEVYLPLEKLTTSGFKLLLHNVFPFDEKSEKTGHYVSFGMVRDHNCSGEFDNRQLQEHPSRFCVRIEAKLKDLIENTISGFVQENDTERLLLEIQLNRIFDRYVLSEFGHIIGLVNDRKEPFHITRFGERILELTEHVYLPPEIDYESRWRTVDNIRIGLESEDILLSQQRGVFHPGKLWRCNAVYPSYGDPADFLEFKILATEKQQYSVGLVHDLSFDDLRYERPKQRERRERLWSSFFAQDISVSYLASENMWIDHSRDSETGELLELKFKSFRHGLYFSFGDLDAITETLEGITLMGYCRLASSYY